MLKKQKSVYLDGKESLESVSNDVVQKKKVSQTVSGMDVQQLHVVKQSRELSSPLKKFSRAKEDITNAFSHLRKRLLECQEFMNQVHGDRECKALTVLISQSDSIADVLQRDHMKVAFFGRTSNGKSTVINSLLRETVLPAGIGHTTNCFCSVVGVEESEGYLVPPNSRERQNVKNVRQLAHSLHKERLDPNSLVQIFWPKAKCPLLSGEVELMDSPGIDMNPDLDQWINKYCLDADVFVLVSNAESTLMTAEKNFFHRVSERLSKPNIFILNNRWDCSAQEEPEMMEEVKKQHLMADIKFLSHELKVVDEATAKDRVFFVSAKEVLLERTKQSKRMVYEEGSGLPSGWKIRMMDFEEFEKRFKQCISSSAIHTKFEKHYEQGSEVVKELEQLLEQEVEDVAKNIQELKVTHKENVEHMQFLKQESQEVRESCDKKVSAAVVEVEQKLTSDIRSMQSRLNRLVKGFLEEQFSTQPLEVYQQKLCEFIDKKMSEMLEEKSYSLGQVHNEAKGFIIEKYQSGLKLSLEDAARFYQQIQPPTPTFALKCSELCQDFKAQPGFDFIRSLGLRNTRLQKNMSLEPLLGGMSSRLSQLWSFIPTEYAVPLVLFGGALLLPKVINWRVWLLSASAYAGLYTWKWCTHDPEIAVKDQLVGYYTSRSKDVQSATCQSYSSNVSEKLQTLLGSLDGELSRARVALQETINQNSQDLQQLEILHSKGKRLKNSTKLTRNNFEEFKSDHLN